MALEGLSERRLTLLRRERIGFVFQSFNLLPSLTAAQNVALPLLLAGRRRVHALQEAFNEVGLAGRRRRRPGRHRRPAAARRAGPRADHRPAWSSSATNRPARSTPRRAAARSWTCCGSSSTRRQTIVMVTHDPTAAARAGPGGLPGRRPHTNSCTLTAQTIAGRMAGLERGRAGAGAGGPWRRRENCRRGSRPTRGGSGGGECGGRRADARPAGGGRRADAQPPRGRRADARARRRQTARHPCTRQRRALGRERFGARPPAAEGRPKPVRPAAEAIRRRVAPLPRRAGARHTPSPHPRAPPVRRADRRVRRAAGPLDSSSGSSSRSRSGWELLCRRHGSAVCPRPALAALPSGRRAIRVLARRRAGSGPPLRQCGADGDDGSRLRSTVHSLWTPNCTARAARPLDRHRRGRARRRRGRRPAGAVRAWPAPARGVLTGDERRLADPGAGHDAQARVTLDALLGTAGGVSAFVSVFVVASVRLRRGAAATRVRPAAHRRGFTPASCAGCLLAGRPAWRPRLGRRLPCSGARGAPYRRALVDGGVAPDWFRSPSGTVARLALPRRLLDRCHRRPRRRLRRLPPGRAHRPCRRPAPEADVDTDVLPSAGPCSAQSPSPRRLGLLVWTYAAEPSELLKRKTYTTQPMPLITGAALLALLVRPAAPLVRHGCRGRSGCSYGRTARQHAYRRRRRPRPGDGRLAGTLLGSRRP